jgi:hypothetical protein
LPVPIWPLGRCLPFPGQQPALARSLFPLTDLILSLLLPPHFPLCPPTVSKHPTTCPLITCHSARGPYKGPLLSPVSLMLPFCQQPGHDIPSSPSSSVHSLALARSWPFPQVQPSCALTDFFPFISTNFSCTTHPSPWWWRQYRPLKCW